MVVLVLISAYSAVEITVLQEQVNSLRNQDEAQQNAVSVLQGEVDYLGSRVAALSSEINEVPPPVASFYIESACVSPDSQCAGEVYSVSLADNGTTTVTAGYGAYLSLNDTTRGTYVGFNVSVPQKLAPGQDVTISSSGWPPGSGGASRISPGDAVIVAVWIGNFEASASTRALTCATTTTTRTLTNHTVSTATLTQTFTSCG